MLFRLVILSILSQFWLTTALAASQSGITYQGRILKPDGTPLAGATTQFKLQIRTPNSADCLMYEEIQSQDLRNSNGVFSLTMNDGSGTRTDTTLLGLDRIFANRASFTFDPTTCHTGSTYTPSVDDGRRFTVLFKDETMAAWEPIPSQTINYVPLAIQATQVQGFGADSLLRVVNASGDPLTGVSPLSNVQWTELQALIAGTSTQYTHAGQIAGSAAPSMTTGQVLGWNGSAWTSVDPLSTLPAFAKTALPACAAGEYLRNSAGALVCSTPASGAGGTVTQVNTGTGLTGGGFTTTGTISISSGGVGTTELAALAVTTVKIADANVTTVKIADANVTAVKLAADSVDSSKILDGSIVGADLNSAINITTSGTVATGVSTTRDFKLYPSSGSFKISLAAPTLSADYTLVFPVDDGAPAQVLTTDGNGNLTWTTPSGTGLSALTGDVTASGSGSVAATVAAVGGSTAANVHTAELAANAATNANTASTIVKRDASGNFTAGTVTSNSNITKSVVLQDTGSNTVALQAPSSIGTSYALKMPTAVAPSTQLLQSDNTGQLSYVAMPSALPPNGAAGGDLSGTYPNPTVATVGTSTAANVHSSELLANAATSANTNSAIVRRDSSGNFSANVVTGNGLTLNNAGSLLNIVNPIGGAWTMTLPATAGSNGQVMQTNGAGVMSWATPLTSTTGFVNGGNSFGAGSSLGTSDNFDLNVNTNNSTRMTVKAGGNVGIGTTEPAYLFDVNGQIHSSSGGFVFPDGTTQVSATGANIWSKNAAYISGAMGGADAVGIGTAYPQAKLDVSGNGSFFGNNAQITISDATENANKHLQLMYTNYSGTNTSVIQSWDFSGMPLSLNPNGGNVGIGTTSPEAMLSVAGPIKIAGAGTETCDATHYIGGIRYNGGNLQFCNASSWQTLGVAGSGISSLTGDVTATGPGAAAATVAQVGGYSAANVAAGATLANAATNANTVNAIVKRDASGNFTAGTVTTSSNVTGSVVYKDSGSNTVTLSAPTTVSSSYALKWPTAAAGSASVLQSDTSGNLSWVTGVAPTGSAGGDLSGTYPNPAVATVGTSTAANVHSAEVAANAATAANTSSTIAKRDGSGNFAANVVTSNGFTLNNAGSLLNIVNPVGGAWTMTLPATAGLNGQVMQTNGSGVMSWATPLTSTTGFVNGGNSFGANASLGTNDSYRLDLKTNNAAAMTLLPGGNVGIGTTAPAVALDVVANTPLYANATLASFRGPPGGVALTITDEGMLGQPVGMHGAGALGLGFFDGPIKFFPAGTETMRVDNTGNVGIGTTSPVYKLSVYSDTVGDGIRAIGNHAPSVGVTNNNLSLISGIASTGADWSKIAQANDAVLLSTGAAASNNLIITNQNSGPITFGTGSSYSNDSAKMTISSAGNVGIGTTAPGAPLDVKGAIRMSGSSSGYTGFQPSAAAGSTVWTLPSVDGTAGQVLNTDGSGKLGWATVSGGGVTQVTSANADIGVATSTTTPLLTLNSGTGANQIVKLDGTAKLPYVDGSHLSNLDAGNVTAGTLAANRGGTGIPSYTAGDLIYAINSSSLGKLPASTSGYLLMTQGSGSAPTWTSMINPNQGGTGLTSYSAGDLIYASSSSSLSKLNAGSSGAVLTANGAGSAPSWSSNLSASSGGTGISSYTIGDLLYANSSNSLSKLSAVASGKVLTSNGVGSAPSWQTAPTSSQWTTQTPGINYTAGYVGIGTTAPRANLDVTGAIVSAAPTATGGSTIDFSTGNLQYTTSSCGVFQLNNLKSGGSYQFAVQGVTSATCSFTAYSDAGSTSLTVHMPPGHGATVASSHTLYSMSVMGSHVYFSWISGY